MPDITCSRCGQTRAGFEKPPVGVVGEAGQRIVREICQTCWGEWLRQPLLLNSMAQLGPGLTWYDLDHDGDDDLLISPSRSMPIAWYRNTGGRFTEVPIGPRPTGDLTTIMPFPTSDGGTRLVAGQSNYESIDDAQTIASAVSLTLNSAGARTSGPTEALGPDSITIGPLAATKMACPSPGMEVEGLYFAALGGVTQYALAGGRLVLSGASAKLTFERAAP